MAKQLVRAFFVVVGWILLAFVFSIVEFFLVAPTSALVVGGVAWLANIEGVREVALTGGVIIGATWAVVNFLLKVWECLSRIRQQWIQTKLDAIREADT